MNWNCLSRQLATIWRSPPRSLQYHGVKATINEYMHNLIRYGLPLYERHIHNNVTTCNVVTSHSTSAHGYWAFRLGIISVTPRYWLTIFKSILSFNILIYAPNVNHIYSFHKFTYKSWNVYFYLFSNRWNRRSNLRLKPINIYRNLLHFCNDICFPFSWWMPS